MIALNAFQRCVQCDVMVNPYGGGIGFWAALCPYDLVYESKVDMIFSAIALITGTATEFPNCL